MIDRFLESVASEVSPFGFRLSISWRRADGGGGSEEYWFSNTSAGRAEFDRAAEFWRRQVNRKDQPMPSFDQIDATMAGAEAAGGGK